MRGIFIETVGAIDQELLLALQATDQPTSRTAKGCFSISSLRSSVGTSSLTMSQPREAN